MESGPRTILRPSGDSCSARPGIGERTGKFLGSGEAILRILFEEPQHRLLQRCGDLFPERGGWNRQAMHDYVRRRKRSVTLERAPPGEHLAQHHPQRPEIRPAIYRFALDLLRGHVGHGPQRCARPGKACVARLCESEIQDLHRAVGQQHQIARLQVAMHDPRAVGTCEPLGGLTRDLDRLADRQRALPRQSRLERFPGVERHRQEEPAVRALPDLVDGAQVGVIEGGGRSRLMEEARLGGGVKLKLGQEELQGDPAAQVGVLGEVDDPHSTGPQRLQHSKMGNDTACEIERIRSLISRSRVRRRDRGGEPAAAADVCCEEGRDGIAHGAVDCAESREPLGALGGGELHQLVEDCSCLPPARCVHGDQSEGGSIVSSARSQARAERSSRLTVASERSMADAVSSSVSPPK
jgi:hypothetical protein